MEKIKINIKNKRNPLFTGYLALRFNYIIYNLTNSQFAQGYGNPAKIGNDKIYQKVKKYMVIYAKKFIAVVFCPADILLVVPKKCIYEPSLLVYGNSFLLPPISKHFYKSMIPGI